MTALRALLSSPAAHALLPLSVQTPGRATVPALAAASVPWRDGAQALVCPLPAAETTIVEDLANADAPCAVTAGVLVLGGSDTPARCTLRKATVVPLVDGAHAGVDLWTTLDLGRTATLWLCRGRDTPLQSITRSGSWLCPRLLPSCRP